MVGNFFRLLKPDFGWGLLSAKWSGLRNSRFALRDFGRGGKSDKNRVGLRSSETASRNFAPVFSKPGSKMLCWKPFFFRKLPKCTRLRTFEIAPPGVQNCPSRFLQQNLEAQSNKKTHFLAFNFVGRLGSEVRRPATGVT